MTNWNALRETIRSKNLGSQTWASDRRHLLGIMDEAEKLGLDATFAEKSSISNLRTIIKVAREAIEKHDLDRLARLFQWAAEFTTSDLRIRIGSHVCEIVYYRKNAKLGKTQFEFAVSPDQFEKIRQITKSQFTFIALEKHER